MDVRTYRYDVITARVTELQTQVSLERECYPLPHYIVKHITSSITLLVLVLLHTADCQSHSIVHLFNMKDCACYSETHSRAMFDYVWYALLLTLKKGFNNHYSQCFHSGNILCLSHIKISNNHASGRKSTQYSLLNVHKSIKENNILSRATNLEKQIQCQPMIVSRKVTLFLTL